MLDTRVGNYPNQLVSFYFLLLIQRVQVSFSRPLMLHFTLLALHLALHGA